MRVEWIEETLDQLSDIYVTLTLDEQLVMARAVERINRQLAGDPESVGESRSPWVRIWFTSGLIIRFDITPAEHEVTVYEVTRITRRKR